MLDEVMRVCAVLSVLLFRYFRVHIYFRVFIVDSTMFLGKKSNTKYQEKSPGYDNEFNGSRNGVFNFD